MVLLLLGAGRLRPEGQAHESGLRPVYKLTSDKGIFVRLKTAVSALPATSLSLVYNSGKLAVQHFVESVERYSNAITARLMYGVSIMSTLALVLPRSEKP